MIRLINHYFTCPHWHRPLFAITPDGIEIKCKWCREKHHISRASLEQAWCDISKLDTSPLHVVRV